MKDDEELITWVRLQLDQQQVCPRVSSTVDWETHSVRVHKDPTMMRLRMTSQPDHLHHIKQHLKQKDSANLGTARNSGRERCGSGITLFHCQHIVEVKFPSRDSALNTEWI